MPDASADAYVLTTGRDENGLALPPGTSFYEVNGPLFFGAAQRAMDSLHASESDAFRTIVIHLGKVPVIDATGFAALENAVDATEEHGLVDLPRGVSFYEINGPLFFGAAQSAMEALHASHRDAFFALVLHLGKVPVIDATGFAALESAVDMLVKRKKVVILAGPLPTPRDIFDKADLGARHHGMVHIAEDLPAAVAIARELQPPLTSRRPHA